MGRTASVLGAKAEPKARAQRVTQAGRTWVQCVKGQINLAGEVRKDAAADGMGTWETNEESKLCLEGAFATQTAGRSG